MSVEHHARDEIVLEPGRELGVPRAADRAGSRRGARRARLEIRNSRNLLFANYHGYRVTRTYQAGPEGRAAVQLGRHPLPQRPRQRRERPRDQRQQGCGTFLRASKYPFENAIEDVTRGRRCASASSPCSTCRADPKPLPSRARAGRHGRRSSPTASGRSPAARSTRTARSISSTAASSASIAGAPREGSTLVRDASLDPVNLAVDRPGTCWCSPPLGPKGTVYSFEPGRRRRADGDRADRDRRDSPASTVALPANWWNNGEFRDQLDPKTDQFTTLAEMFARDIAAPEGAGIRLARRQRSRCRPSACCSRARPAGAGRRPCRPMGSSRRRPGERVFVTNGSENKTYSGAVGAGGTLTDLKPFANRGGESVAVDAGRPRLRRQRPGVRLRAGRQGGRPHRRARAAAAAPVRRHGPAHAVHPDAPRALRRAADQKRIVTVFPS